ncbi:MAG: M81 family metallopeptidase [Pseudomonadota bacterium]
MNKVAVGGFQHETNTFSNRKGTFESFVESDGWPGLTRGPDLVKALRGYNIGVSGLLDGASEQGWEIAPLTWAYGGSSGKVTEEAFERISKMILDDLSQALPIDGLLLDLHGAMVTEHLDNGDGEFLQRVRNLVGPDLPIVACLDLHANLTDEMVDLTDMLVIYRSYPHLDMADTGRRAASQLARLLAGAPKEHKVMLRIPFLIPNTRACTMTEPSQSLYRRLAVLEQQPGISHISMSCGFNPSDVPHCGPAIITYGTDKKAVEAASETLYREVLAQEMHFENDLWAVDEAVRYALKNAPLQGPPIVLADILDNYGGGTSSDTNWIITELVRQKAANAVVGLLWDAEAAMIAHQAGVGAEVTLDLGGKSGLHGHQPYRATYNVEALGDGEIRSTGFYFAGGRLQLGPMALLRVGGVRIAVSSHGEQAADQAMFTHLGVDPSRTQVLVLKSSVHYRADFQPIAQEVLEVEAPAPMVADNRNFVYKNLRSGLRLMPGGPAFKHN